MAATAKKPKYTLEIEAPSNGRIRQATILVRDADGKIRASDRGDLLKATERRRVGKELARLLGDDDAKKWQNAVESKWSGLLGEQQRIRESMAAGSPESAGEETMVLLPDAPPIIRRPLALIDGNAYAASWLTARREVKRSVDPKSGAVSEYNPPLVTLAPVLVVVRNDNQLFADVALPNARPLSELGVEARLPAPVPPGNEWSGAGVNRFLAGERADPADVFRRVAGVVDRFIDFSRSLAPQETMCEMAACFVLSTYFLDAFNVVGYLWPNGEKGSGKTQFLQVVSEMSYLGQIILAGSSYPCLRDLADCGATLAFDDAEAVMDARHSDPDKRTLLLAGSRRGATIAVKELAGDKWETRHVNTFCPRLFSAIRLPDDVLGSRSIVVPLVRSGDPRRAKSNPMDAEDWPTDRRRLIDDLWALSLAHLAEMPKFDRLAASNSQLCGRNLDPWRPILAVAAWLESRHRSDRLFDRMEKLSRDYQQERGEIEETDKTRVLFRALLQLSEGWSDDRPQAVQPQAIAEAMNEIAKAQHLAEQEKQFTSARSVGRLLKRQRFQRSAVRSERGKLWKITRGEIVTAARAYGVEPVVETAERQEKRVSAMGATKVIVAREHGYFRTVVACRLLNLNVTDLLALRRRLLERALGIRPLPPLAAAEVDSALHAPFDTDGEPHE